MGRIASQTYYILQRKFPSANQKDRSTKPRVNKAKSEFATARRSQITLAAGSVGRSSSLREQVPSSLSNISVVSIPRQSLQHKRLKHVQC